MDSSLLYQMAVPGLRYLLPSIVWSGDDPRQMALSFDDGPHPTFTSELLDCIERNRIKASFFVLGKHLREPANQALVRRMLALGCEVGIHGYSHDSFSSMTRAEIWREIGRTARLLEEATGQPSESFRHLRLPRGLATPCQMEWLCSEGYRIFTCDSLPGDWDKDVSDDEIMARVHRDIGQHRRFIALHDGVDVDETAGRRVARVVQSVVDAHCGDFVFVTVSEMIRKAWPE